MSFVENKISNPSYLLRNIKRNIKLSIDHPEKFWKKKASSIDWIKKFFNSKRKLIYDDVSIKWFSEVL